jgi:magnesium chelatase family protein
LQRYRARLSAPLRDRIDLIVEVPAVTADALSDLAPGEATAAVRSRVCAARAIQRARFAGQGASTNAALCGRALSVHGGPDPGGRRLLRTAVERLGLSARGYDRVLKVARTIADLAGSGGVTADHVAEALQYRMVE